MTSTTLRLESLESRNLMAADVLAVDYSFQDDAANRSSPGTAEIDFVEVAGGDGVLSKPMCYLKYKLDRAFIEPWSTTGDLDGRPVEGNGDNVDAAFASADLM